VPGALARSSDSDFELRADCAGNLAIPWCPDACDAGRVWRIEAASGVVVVVELLREKWRELFRVVDPLFDSGP